MLCMLRASVGPSSDRRHSKPHHRRYRMKPRCLLSTVDRLPTISETQESEADDRNPHTLEEYVDSIKELSRPAPYPRHGPLQGHRRWAQRAGAAGAPLAPSLFLSSFMSQAPWTPIDLSDVLLTLKDQSNYDTPARFNYDPLNRSTAQSVFAGLV